MIDWERIRSAKQAEVESLAGMSVSEITPSRRDFAQFVGGDRRAPEVIGTVRRRDPYSGRGWPDIDVAEFSGALDDADVAAIAVTTEPIAFAGSLRDLRIAADAATAPVLRDDFVVHPSQVYQSRLHGADAIVVPVAWVSDGEVAELVAESSALHMATLLAIFRGDDVSRVLSHDKTIVGVWGAREDGEIDFDLVRHVAAAVPLRRTIVLLGGVATAAAWPQLRGQVDAALVAAPLLDAPEVAGALLRFDRD